MVHPTGHRLLFITLGIFAAALLLAGITAAIVLYQPWYNGTWNGDFSAEECLSMIKKGEDLKILQISDLHADHTNEQHDLIWKNLERTVAKSDADLTIVTGDWTSDADNLPATEKLIEVMEGCKKPWAVIFGNHDAQGAQSRDDLAALFEQAEHCLFARGPADLSGVGNYVINVYHQEDPSRLVASLVLFDSHIDKKKPLQYEPIYRDQVRWYEKTIAGLNAIYSAQKNNKAEVLPSLVFQHIPLREYETAWNEGKVDTAKHLHGSNNEDVYAPVVNTGLFDKMVEAGSTKGVFCGHDHANDSAVAYRGILLTYAVQSGVCESDPYAQKMKKGGNLITLKEDGTLTVEQVFHETGYRVKSE